MEAIDPKLLRSVPLFADLTSSQLDKLSAIFQPRRAAAGTVLVREGEELQEFFVLVEGQVDLLRSSSSGEVRLLEQWSAGSWFGEVALVHDAAAMSTVRTVSPCRLLVAGRSAWEELLFVNRDLAYWLLWSLVRRLAGRLRKNARRLADLERRGKPRESAPKKLEPESPA